MGGMCKVGIEAVLDLRMGVNCGGKQELMGGETPPRAAAEDDAPGGEGVNATLVAFGDEEGLILGCGEEVSPVVSSFDPCLSTSCTSTLT